MKTVLFGIVLLCAAVVDAIGLARTHLEAAEPIRIGTHRELFVDQALVERLDGSAELRLHRPTPREVALAFDKPWEGNASGYATVFQDSDIYRMYYRGHHYVVDEQPLRQAQPEVVCYAESRDGIHWVKPNLGLFDWQGSKENNIIWRGGPETHNFAPFKDTNPDCLPEERYKAVGGTTASRGLLTFKSADGTHWEKLSETPVVTKGAFDSHNTAFWDAERSRYVMYVRYFSEGEFKGLRLIGESHSTDFRTWSEPVGAGVSGFAATADVHKSDCPVLSGTAHPAWFPDSLCRSPADEARTAARPGRVAVEADCRRPARGD